MPAGFRRLLFLLVLFLLAGAAARQPSGTPLGVNIEGLVDYGRSMMFVDMMKAARKFGSAEAPWDGKAAVDARGWPTGDAGVVVMTEQKNLGGTYKLSFTGRAEVNLLSTSGTIDNGHYDETTNVTTADVNLDDSATQLFLTFTRTTGGVRDVTLLRPGYKPSGVFTREFLALLRPFSVLRTMDLTRTNQTDVVAWADCPKPDDATQATSRGVAWEYVIDLANQTGKDLWINVPDRASDDYVRELAKLFKEKLKPERVLYVEYSNEVWNTIFPCSGRNFAAARKEVAAGDTALNDGGKDTNEYYWAWKRVAKRTVELRKLFTEIYGEKALNHRVRMVLGSQSGQPFMLRLQLEYMEKYHGPPAKFIYAVAGAPYFGIDGKLNERPDLTLDMIFENIPQNVKGLEGEMIQYVALARHYGVKPMCYEGGPGFEGEKSFDVKRAAQYDPRMQQAVENYLRTWFNTGGDLFCYYASSGWYTRHGCWGLTDDVRKTSPKIKAVEKIARTPLAVPSAGFAVPANIAAIACHWRAGGDLEDSRAGGKHLAFLRDGANFDYLISTPTRGKFQVRVEVASESDTPRLELLVNGQPIQTLKVPNTGGYHTYGYTDTSEITLQPGTSDLRLRVVSAGMNLRSIEVK